MIKYELALAMNQGSFCVCTQPVREDIMIYHLLSLAGRIHKMIPSEQTKENGTLNCEFTIQQ